MGRLFWKFFFFIWLAQLTAIAGISTTFWLKHLELDKDTTSTHTADFGKPPPFSDGPRFSGREQGPGPGMSPRGEPSFRGGPPLMRGQPHDEISRALVPMSVAFFASLLFAALMAWYMAKPIRRLSEAFHALASGSLHTRIGDSMGQRQDELTALGRDFDRMAEQLTGALQSQRRLLHDVSHELRSPLARLQAAIGLARQQPQKAEEYMIRMEREAIRMDKLVGELLTLSRLEAGANIGQDLIHMDELMIELMDTASFEAQSVKKNFVTTCLPERLALAGVKGKYELLYRAFENVLRNALRHTRPGSTVTLEVAVLSNEIQVTVLDEGSGVPEAELDNIFRPFYRGHDAERNTDGYGLGLAITQRVIQAHGGRIVANNRQEGGLSMRMSLPLVGMQ